MVKKPSELEEEYIARMEYEKRKKIEEGKHKKLAEEEKIQRTPLHEGP
jgi:hypothetical protein